MGFPVISPDDHARLLQAGWQMTHTRSIQREDTMYEQREYTKDIPCCERVARAACRSFAILLCFPCVPILVMGSSYCCGDECSDRYFGPAVRNGYDLITRHVLNQEETDKMHCQDADQLGFTPQDKEAMRAYMNAHNQEVRKHKGHEFLRYQAPVGHASYVLFAPYGNRDDIRRYSLGSSRLSAVQARIEQICSTLNDTVETTPLLAET